jgi:uracil-DNA glycosylase
MSRLGTGSPEAKIMIVGECFTEAEEYSGEAFLGMGGENLNKMLHEVGLSRTECYLTNLVNLRPPGSTISSFIAEKKGDITAAHKMWKGKWVTPQIIDGYSRLLREIEMVKPNLIISCGNAPTWALTGAWGVMKWHGSQLNIDGDSTKTKVIPTYHPVQINWAYDLRAIMVNDLRRCAREAKTRHYTNIPEWKFTIRPSFEVALHTLIALRSMLTDGPMWISFDLETRAGHITCAGLAWSKTEAICIPLMVDTNWEGYWTLEEEAVIVYNLYLILTHRNAKVLGQNLLYDSQYCYRHWHFVPRVVQDTMISFHTMFAGLPKRLDFQASVLCDYYVQWKPDKDTWKSGG